VPCRSRSGTRQRRHLARSVVVDPGSWNRDGGRPADPPLLGLVQEVVVDGRRAILEYVARDRTSTRRVVDPLGLALKGSLWYLLAGTEKGQRTFRVDRMRSVEATTEPVERPEGFDLAEAWGKVADEIEERRTPERAKALVAKENLSFLRYLFGKRMMIGGPGADERVEVELRGASQRSLAGEIAGLGGLMEIIEPDEVRQLLGRIATELSELYRPVGRGSGRKVRIGEVMS
jgi:predicted DNA-binding transcriptional regulator YafY